VCTIPLTLVHSSAYYPTQGTQSSAKGPGSISVPESISHWTPSPSETLPATYVSQTYTFDSRSPVHPPGANHTLRKASSSSRSIPPVQEMCASASRSFDTCCLSGVSYLCQTQHSFKESESSAPYRITPSSHTNLSNTRRKPRPMLPLEAHLPPTHSCLGFSNGYRNHHLGTCDLRVSPEPL
jgi:hypothetical protein